MKAQQNLHKSKLKAHSESMAIGVEGYKGSIGVAVTIGKDELIKWLEQQVHASEAKFNNSNNNSNSR